MFENGKYKFLSQEYGMSRISNNVYHGKVNGYYTVIQLDDQSRTGLMWIGASRNEYDDRLEYKLQEIREIKGVKAVNLQGKSISTFFKIPFTKNGFKEFISHFFEMLTSYLSSKGYGSGCFVTGIDDGTVRLVQVNEKHQFLSETGIGLLEESLDQNRAEIAQRPENFFLGLFGAVGGALIGGVLWAIMGLLGFWAWFAGIIGFTLAFQGYAKLGGKVGKFASVVIFVLCIAAIFAGSVGEWAWHVYKAYKVDIPDLTYFEAYRETLPLIFSDPEITGEFLFDIGLGIGLVFVIGIPLVIKMYSENAGNYKIKRID